MTCCVERTSTVLLEVREERGVDVPPPEAGPGDREVADAASSEPVDLGQRRAVVGRVTHVDTVPLDDTHDLPCSQAGLPEGRPIGQRERGSLRNRVTQLVERPTSACLPTTPPLPGAQLAEERLQQPADLPLRGQPPAGQRLVRFHDGSGDRVGVGIPRTLERAHLGRIRQPFRRLACTLRHRHPHGARDLVEHGGRAVEQPFEDHDVPSRASGVDQRGDGVARPEQRPAADGDVVAYTQLVRHGRRLTDTEQAPKGGNHLPPEGERERRTGILPGPRSRSREVPFDEPSRLGTEPIEPRPVLPPRIRRGGRGVPSGAQGREDLLADPYETAVLPEVAPEFGDPPEVDPQLLEQSRGQDLSGAGHPDHRGHGWSVHTVQPHAGRRGCLAGSP